MSLAGLYTREYLLSDFCEGIVQFQAGRGLSPLKHREVALLRPEPGKRVLDAGCGRGEVLRACAEAGAVVAGCDFSQDAVELSRETLADVAPDADVRQADVLDLPWPDDHFDAVLSGDVIEHLRPEETGRMLRELRRVLRPGGTLVLHTAPNRLFLDVTWPVAKPLLRLLGHGAVVARTDAWIAESKRFHFNEQRIGPLRRSVRAAGFNGVRGWVDRDVVRTEGHHLTEDFVRTRTAMLATRVGQLRPLRTLTGNDLWVVATA